MITFENTIDKRDLYENQSIHFSQLLSQYAKNSMGLVEESIRISIEYKTLKDKYTISHHNLRAINQYLNKNYKSEFKQYQQNKSLQLRINNV